jgi:Protein of unknown function (DUF2690)
LLAPTAPASAASCSGQGCNYLDPEAAGCGPATTLAEFTTHMFLARIELRYSSTCNAAWARITASTWGYAGWDGDYLVIAAWYNTTSTSSLAAASTDVSFEAEPLGSGGVRWSRMFQFSPWWVSACLSPVNYAGPSDPNSCTSRR